MVIGGTLLSGGVGYVAGTLFGVLILGIVQTLIASTAAEFLVDADRHRRAAVVFCLLQRLFEKR